MLEDLDLSSEEEGDIVDFLASPGHNLGEPTLLITPGKSIQEKDRLAETWSTLPQVEAEKCTAVSTSQSSHRQAFQEEAKTAKTSSSRSRRDQRSRPHQAEREKNAKKQLRLKANKSKG